VPVGEGRDELWLVSPDASQQERIIAESTDEAVDWRWPYWSRDGRFLFADRFLPDGAHPPALYALDLRTDSLQRIGDDIRVLDQNREGTLLLGNTSEGTLGRLWTLNWPTATTPVSLTPQGWSDAQGRWSADGTQIVFVSAQSPEAKQHLWLMSSDGGQRHQLTSGTGNEYLPRWLPNGGNEYILFLHNRHELHLLMIETGESRLVLEKANVDYVTVPLQN